MEKNIFEKREEKFQANLTRFWEESVRKGGPDRKQGERNYYFQLLRKYCETMSVIAIDKFALFKWLQEAIKASISYNRVRKQLWQKYTETLVVVPRDVAGSGFYLLDMSDHISIQGFLQKRNDDIDSASTLSFQMTISNLLTHVGPEVLPDANVSSSSRILRDPTG